MNIMELGALGEFVGSIGVIVTLAYVAVQIRQNTQSVRVNNRRIETDRNIAHTRFAIATPGLMSIYRRGQEDPSDLTPDEYLVFTSYLYSMVLDLEEKYLLQEQEGIRQRRVGPGYDRLVVAISPPSAGSDGQVGRGGGRQWWDRSHDNLNLDPGFVSYFNRLLAESDAAEDASK